MEKALKAIIALMLLVLVPQAAQGFSDCEGDMNPRGHRPGRQVWRLIFNHQKADKRYLLPRSVELIQNLVKQPLQTNHRFPADVEFLEYFMPLLSSLHPRVYVKVGNHEVEGELVKAEGFESHHEPEVELMIQEQGKPAPTQVQFFVRERHVFQIVKTLSDKMLGLIRTELDTAKWIYALYQPELKDQIDRLDRGEAVEVLSRGDVLGLFADLERLGLSLEVSQQGKMKQGLFVRSDLTHMRMTHTEFLYGS